jgi:hypothetical protein
VFPLLAALATGCGGGKKSEVKMELTHEQTLQWIHDHKAWGLAKKTRPIWARPVEPDEVGREFQTADHVKQEARAGFWLCVGVAGEPWFQDLGKITGKYEAAGEEVTRFSFDDRERTYRVYRPRGEIRNWVAQVKGDGITGFWIKPSYDPSRPLYSPAGGYVVKDHVPDPYQGSSDTWLVQEGLFTSTYELVE